MFDSTIYGMTGDDLENVLMGKTITRINEQESLLYLSDGTELEFEDIEDCCAWFAASLSKGNLTDNAVTRVEVTDNPTEGWGAEDYTIHVLAGNKNIVDVNIHGNEGTGYYCHSINLVVRQPKK